jgi:predicted dehydrogenase
MRKVKFGIIGAGNIGTAHLKDFMADRIPSGELVGIADLVPEKLEAIKKIAEEANPEAAAKITYFNSGDELIASGVCEAVMVAIPHYFHPVYVIKALKAGLHVISEKPAGVYTLQVQEMLDEAAKHPELKAAIMFNVRTNPRFIKMHDMIANGELGQITRLTWIITNWFRTQAYYDNGGWRATWKGEGGGVLFNQSPHQLDLFQWVPGMMPNKVHAHCHFGKWHNIEVEDDVTAYVEYPNGATGVFITTTGEKPGTNRFEITGEYGKLVYENETLTHHKIPKSMLHVIKDSNVAFEKGDIEVINVECPGEYTRHYGVITNFCNSILGTEELRFPITEGINGVILANAMLLSQWKGSAIELPIDGQAFYDELQAHIAASTVSKDENAAGSVSDTSNTYAK